MDKGNKVAVIGLGGLGHMALKLANALGADVTLFTRKPNKEKNARRLGTHNIVLSTDKGQMASVQGRFDLIIDTVPYVHDLNHYLPTLTINGTLVFLGYLGDLEPALSTVPLVMGQRSVAGSVKRAYTFEVGDIAYWSPVPDVATYYRHNYQRIPEPGIIIIGRVDSGVETFNVTGSVKVTVELVK